MIHIEVRKDQEQILSIRIHGHAESAEYGKDLVCAGASSVAFGILNAIDEMEPNTCEIQVSKVIQIRVVRNTERLQTILQCAIWQFKTLEFQNSDYITIQEV